MTLSMLAQVAGGLVDISGSDERYSLLRMEFHSDLLDRMAGLGGRRAEIAAAHEAQAGVEAALIRLVEAQRQKGERLEVMRFQREELVATTLEDPLEEDALEAERRLLGNAEKLRSTSKLTEAALFADDGAPVERLGRAARSVRELAEVDPTLAPVARNLGPAEARRLISRGVSAADIAAGLRAAARETAERSPHASDRSHSSRRAAPCTAVSPRAALCRA